MQANKKFQRTLAPLVPLNLALGVQVRAKKPSIIKLLALYKRENRVVYFPAIVHGVIPAKFAGFANLSHLLLAI